jgi:DNA-directed RNA polymerase specialized sigma24 family protein
MAAARNASKPNRDCLLHAILNVLKGWPELHRSIFIQAHYQGKSQGEISRGLELCAEDVRRILDVCDRRLRSALREFRSSIRQTGECKHFPEAACAASRSLD